VRHFHRTTLSPDAVLRTADSFFPAIGLSPGPADRRSRRFSGLLGALRLAVRMEGGHYTFVEAHTDQVGESRLDKNVKKFFVALHRQADPRHRLEAGY
jgi:hypothetical protein